jgi:hypothetical protein
MLMERSWAKKRDKQDGDKVKDLKKKQRIEDHHKHWHIKPNENFSELFWKNTSHCPKAKNGNIICMKFFLKGFCHRACNRVHKLSAEEEKEYDEFVIKCRSSDFQQEAEESNAP